MVRFNRVGYSPSKVILALFTKKSNVVELIKTHSSILIQFAKIGNQAVISIEPLERWYYLKVNRISLERYLGIRKMELFKSEIESSTRIRLKITRQ